MLSNLVDLVIEEEPEQDLIEKTVAKLAQSIEAPIEDNIKDGFGCDGNKPITLHNFVTLGSSNFGAQPLGMLLLFYDLGATYYGALKTDALQVNLLASVISAKHLESGKVAKAKPAPAAAKSAAPANNKFAGKNLDQIIGDVSKAVTQAAKEWLEDFQKIQDVILNKTKFDMVEKTTKPEDVSQD